MILISTYESTSTPSRKSNSKNLKAYPIAEKFS